MPMESVVSQVMEKGIPGVVGHEFSHRRHDHPVFVMDANEGHMIRGHSSSSNSRESMPSHLSPPLSSSLSSSSSSAQH